MHQRSYKTIVALAVCAVAGALVALAAMALAGLEMRRAILVGVLAGALAYVLRLMSSIFGERGRMIAWVTEQDRTLPELTERPLRMEQNVTALISELTAEQARKTAALTAELGLLRTMMERLASEGRFGARGGAAGASGDGAGEGERAATDIAALLRSALRESRVDLYLQPIVRLPNRKVVHYEALSRLRDEEGRVFTPSDYLGEAAEAGLVSLLDNLLLFRSINLIRKLGPRRPGVRLFCNMSAASLADETFMTELAEFLGQQPELPGRLVFEVAAGDLEWLPESAVERLETLARLGFAFSVDNVTDVSALDSTCLARLNVRFLKMDAAVFLNAPIGAPRETLAETLEHQGVTLIITRIETDRTAAEVVELGAACGQGYLFGAPRPGRGVAAPPPDVASASSAPGA